VAVVALEFFGGRLEAGYVVGEMFSIGTWLVKWVERWGEFSCEEVDVRPYRFLSKVSGAFAGSQWMCKITMVGWAVSYQ
jgi:hypothetical protein